MEDEVFEIYDNVGHLIGTDIRANAHHKGLWHAVIHVWLYEWIQGELWIYFQQRSYQKKDFAGLYDITTAGHVDVLEAPVDAAIRECQEEIGVTLTKEQLTFLGDVKEAVYLSDFKDKEIAHVFVAEVQQPTFVLGEEVEGMKKTRGEDFLAYATSRKQGIPLYDIVTKEKRYIMDSQCCNHASIYYAWIWNHIQQIRNRKG